MSDTHKHKNKRKYLLKDYDASGVLNDPMKEKHSKYLNDNEPLNDKDYPIEMFKSFDRENSKKGGYNSRTLRNKERYGRSKNDFKIEEDEKD